MSNTMQAERPPKGASSAISDGLTIGQALRELGDKLPNRPDLLWLMAALDHYRRDDQDCRDHWDRHANLRFKLRDGTDARASGDEYWRRSWNMREKARRIIDGREPWPAELRVWKTYRELRHYHAGAECPAWLDEKNERGAVRVSEARSRARRALGGRA